MDEHAEAPVVAARGHRGARRILTAGGKDDPRALRGSLTNPTSTDGGGGPISGTGPPISVVVASNRERSLLEGCLASLRSQCARTGAELIVVRAAVGPASELAELRRSMPDVHFVEATANATIPELRGAGMSRASGSAVATTEDHCVAGAGWLDALLVRLRGGAAVVGGGMGNAQRRRAVDWGAYFSEYGFFAETRRGPQHGARLLLTGANVAYTREVARDVAAWACDGEWENVLHGRLAARGVAMEFAPDAVVYQNKNYRFMAFCVDRYEHGRDFARKRLAETPGTPRWALAGASALLPALLTWRVARAAAPGRWLTFLRALPATFAFLTAWSVGEAIGYARGASARDGL
ncbi:MAG: glycosyltransferase [Gemmatimonadaceae bacterium]